ncbi:MAG: carboxypeptidase regulatory-like domain-containing protein [Acidobacteriaceae bacterium]
MQYRLGKCLIIGMVLGVLLCLFSGEQASAQMDQGTITGVIRDSAGAVIPGSQVTLTNNDTGLTLKATSDGSGIYTFSPVKIGNYTVTAGATGFKTTSQEHVHLDVQERLNVPVTLTPGAMTQTITISAAPALLQTQSGSVGQVLSTRTINSTALNGRNWVYIAQLTAGVDPSAGSRGAGDGDYEANGQTAGQNNFILDGVDNNTSVVDYLNGASFAVRPPPDALQEFKISTSDYSAEFGHSAGSVMNASIKSGTNQIHGDLWEYFRNNVLDARDFDALTIPKYRQNQFGATLGFPIIRNKLFFFADGEANRIVFGETSTQTVPTAKMRQGNFSELLNPALTGSASPIQLYQPNSGGTATVACSGVNNVYCKPQLDPVALNILSLYPAPNTNGALTYNNRIVNLNATDNRWAWDTRMDWDISAKDQFFGRFSYLNEPSFYPSPLGPILDGGGYQSDGRFTDLADNFAGSETHIFNPNLTNEFRFGYNYGRFGIAPGQNTDTNLSAQLGFGGIPYSPGIGGLPPTTVGGISGFGAPEYYPVLEIQNTYQILDNVTKLIGNHSIKFGVELESLRFNFSQPVAGHGQYGFTGLYSSNPGISFTGFGVADFLTDQINSATLSPLGTVSDSRWYRAAYVQDNWRVTTKLTLNLGLRYEYFQPYIEDAGEQANFIVTGPLGIGTGAATLTMPVQSQKVPLSPAFITILQQDHVTLKYVNNQSLSTAQLDNFSPRLGFAYQIDAKTVIRGGFGIFYGALESQGGSTNLGFQYPFEFTSTFPAPNCTAGVGNCPSNGLTLETGFSKEIAAGIRNAVSFPPVNGRAAHTITPYSQSENLTVQRSLTPNLAVSIGYVGNVGRHVLNLIFPNSADALENPGNNAQFVQPFPQFGRDLFIPYTGASSYNSLQSQIQKRYASGLSFLATYTWSHSIDNAPQTIFSSSGAGYSGYRNNNLIPINDEFANSPWDTPQRFTFNGLYDLPFGIGRAHANHAGLANLVYGGWSTSLTFAAQSGNPITIYPNISTASGGSSFAILKRDPFAPGGNPDPSNPNIACAQKTRTKLSWFNPCAFANPLPGSLISPGPNGGNPNVPQPGYTYPEHVTNIKDVVSLLGGRRNQIRGPGYERINMSIFKDFPTYRTQRLEFRTDIFNVLNTPAYGDPGGGINTNGGLITSPRFFQSYTPDARFFQLSLKYIF